MSSTYPSLRVLGLLRIWFDANELQDRRNVLAMRARHNAPVHNLRLRLCNNYTADQVQLLRKVVVNDIGYDQYILGHS